MRLSGLGTVAIYLSICLGLFGGLTSQPSQAAILDLTDRLSPILDGCMIPPFILDYHRSLVQQGVDMPRDAATPPVLAAIQEPLRGNVTSVDRVKLPGTGGREAGMETSVWMSGLRDVFWSGLRVNAILYVGTDNGLPSRILIQLAALQGVVDATFKNDVQEAARLIPEKSPGAGITLLAFQGLPAISCSYRRPETERSTSVEEVAMLLDDRRRASTPEALSKPVDQRLDDRIAALLDKRAPARDAASATASVSLPPPPPPPAAPQKSAAAAASPAGQTAKPKTDIEAWREGASIELSVYLDPLLDGCSVSPRLMNYFTNEIFRRSKGGVSSTREGVSERFSDLITITPKTLFSTTSRGVALFAFPERANWQGHWIDSIAFETGGGKSTWRIMVTFHSADPNALDNLLPLLKPPMPSPQEDLTSGFSTFAGRAAFFCKTAGMGWLTGYLRDDGSRPPNAPAPSPVKQPEPVSVSRASNPVLLRDSAPIPSPDAPRLVAQATTPTQVNVSFCNKTSKMVDLMHAFPPAGSSTDWTAIGWTNIAAGKCAVIQVPEGLLHWHAMSATRTWGGNDAFYCVPTRRFEKRVFAQEKCVSGERKLGARETYVDSSTQPINLVP